MTDSIKTLKCPACSEEMTKIFITDKGINLDVCANNCGGIFFDCKEFQQCTKSENEITELKRILENKNFMPVDETQIRICPACNTPMVKTRSFGIHIDSCNNCGGIFLDNSEFKKIRDIIQAQKKKPNPNAVQYKDIDLHAFCKDALDENRRITNISKIADRLNRETYFDPRYPLTSFFRLFF